MVAMNNRLLLDVSAEVAAREALVTFQDIKTQSRSVQLAPALDARRIFLSSGCNIIAGFDRFASDWSDHKEPVDFAEKAQALGASILSYTVRRGAFSAAVTDVKRIKAAIDLPLFLDDLIVDPYQIHEARVLGVDLLSLATWSMEQAKLESLLDRIESLGMTALIKVRNPDEARRAVAAGASVIAIDITGYQGRLSFPAAFSRICDFLPLDVVRIVFGGCENAKQLIAFARSSADAIYVPHTKLENTRSLIAAGMHPACPSR